ncbi:MAG: hypothetical protein HYW65_00085 [Candidatus Liptonbacteria bacterium]|nr:hypothetical protein [Candidatus Liptonbacteria bacterium]
MDLNVDTGSSAPRSKAAAPPLVPTPPAEVFIRTLESDLRSFRESGGLLAGQAGARPKPERVMVSGGAAKEVKPLSFFAGKNIELKWLLIAGGAAVALGAVLVYGFSRLSFPSFPSAPPAAPMSGLASSSELAAGEEEIEPFSPSEPEQTSAPRGILRKPADRTASFAASGVVENVAELKTPAQRLRETLAAVPAATSSTLIEVVPKDADGARVPLGQFLERMDAGVLPPEFLAARFAEQFVFFVFRDKAGFWPGFVLALRPGENWLFLKDEVAALERSPKLANFFLEDPGEAGDEWSDARVGDVAVRELEWTPATKSANAANPKFVYGWFRGYLVISTSEEGLAAILPRL